MNFSPTWVAVGLVGCMTFGLAAFLLSRPAFYERCVGSATPGSLGAIRVLICSLLFLSVLWEQFPLLAALPVELRKPMGFVQFLYKIPFFESVTRSETGLFVFQCVTATILFLGMIGWKTRLVVPLSAFCFFTFAGLLRQYSFFWHQHLIPFYVLTVLSFTPCGDGWSVDRLIKGARGQRIPDAYTKAARYGWARYAVWTAIAFPYVFAGFSKFRNAGLLWWNANTMRRIFYTDTLNPMQFDWGISDVFIHMPDIVPALLGIAGVWGEALYGFALISRIGRRVFPAAMGFMHFCIMLLQNILFFDLIFIQSVFFDWSKAGAAIGRWLSHQEGALKHFQDWWCRLDQRPRTLSPTAAWSSAASKTTAQPQAVAPIIIAGFMAVLVSVWTKKVEFFPLTSMQMYSQPSWLGTDPIVFYKVFAHTESGQSSRELFKQAMGVMTLNARYRAYMWKCFKDEKKMNQCAKFFSACTASYNRKAPTGRRITMLELQKWDWDYIHYPKEFGQGKWLGSVTIDVATAKLERQGQANAGGSLGLGEIE